MEPVQDNQFDENWRKKLERFEPAVPEHLWEGIAGQIAMSPTPRILPERKQRKLPWLKIAVAISLLVGGAYFYNEIGRDSRPVGIQEVVSGQETSVHQKQIRTPTEGNSLLAEKETGLPERKRVRNLEKKTSQQTAGAVSQQMVKAEQEPIIVARQREHERFEGQVAKVDFSVDLDLAGGNLPQANKLLQPLPQAMVIAEKPKKRFDASDVLNYVVKSVNQGEEKVLSFASDEEGILKVSVHLNALKIKL